MRLPHAARPLLPRMATLVCAVLLAACTTSPTSGRTQFNILPGTLETAVPDLRFDVKTLLAAGREFCKEEQDPCPAQEAAGKLAQRIAPIAERLGTLTAELSPELVTRVPHVEVFVVPNDSPSVSSSAGGKIAVSSGLARLELPDTDLALALAREFGRLASAHHRESTSAGLAVSLVAGSPLTSAYLATSILADIIFPMGALAKIGISLLASMGTEQLVEASQQDEADEFAGKLLLAAGYDLRELAVVRPDAPESAIKLGWLPNYYASRAKVAGLAPPPETMAATTAAQEPPLEAKAEDAAPPMEMAGNAAANPGLPTEARPLPAATPPAIAVPEADAQKPVTQARDETIAPPDEPTAKAVATPRPQPEARPGVAAITPEMTAAAANAQQPATEAKDEPVAPPVEMTARAAANPEPPAEGMVAAAAPAPAAMTPLALASREPAPMEKTEAVTPPRQTAETPEVQESPPAAKPAVAKVAKKGGVAKPPLKKRKTIRKPSKKPVRR